MSTITENQQRAYLAQAQDVSRELANRLRNLSPAQQAAILASCAHEANTPIDVILTTHESRDGMEAAMILDGDVPTDETGGWSWKIGSGCVFQIVVLP